MTYNKIILIVYVAYLVIMSLVSLALFFKDKKMAQRNGNAVRIKEKTLLSSVVFGGAIGAFFGRILAHHKTDKKYFSFTIYLAILLQVGLVAILALLAFM